MALYNLEFSDSDDSTLRIHIASRLSVNSKTVKLLTFMPPMGDSPKGMLVIAYWFFNPHCPGHQVFYPLDMPVICCFRRCAEDQPIIQSSQHPEWFSQQHKPPSRDRDWNKTVPAIYESIQPWISELAKQTNSRLSFNKLMDTPLDFSDFLINRLKVDTLTLELLAGPTYELINGVTKLVAENEHLKQTYKQLYYSIKSSRVRSKEQCDDLIKQVNIKSAEIFDLNASLQEKVLNNNKKIRFTEPIPSSGNTHVKTTSSTNVVSNTSVLSSTGVNFLSSASGSQPQGNTKKDRIQLTQSKAKKNKLEDHPRTVRPSLNKKKSVIDTKSISFVPNSKSNVNSDLKCATSKQKVPVSNSKIIKSLVANKEEPNNSWGSIISNVPSSTVKCRLSKLFSDFDELTAMASEQHSLGPALNEMTPATINSGLVQKHSSSTPYVPPSRNDWDLLFQPMFDKLL
nr:hypothetical protein [Tanacetum cinerariifolium]